MMLGLLTSLTLIAPPVLPEASPPRPKRTPVTITIVGAVITVSDETSVRWKAVKTPDGARIRLTINEFTTDTTHLRISGAKLPEGRTMDLRVDKNGDVMASPDPREPLPTATPKSARP